MNRTPFRIDVISPAGAISGPGPLTTILSLNNTVSLDRMGSLTFTVPAGDVRTALITPGCQFDVYDEQDGFLGRYFYSRSALSESAGDAKLQITAFDQMQALSLVSVGFRRKYSDADVRDVASDLALVAGWNVNTLNEIGNAEVTYEGDSVLAAIDRLRDDWGQHFRIGALNTLDFGLFGAKSGVRLTNLAGQVQSNFAGHTEVAIPRPIRQTVSVDDIANRIIALGAGQGTGQLTMAGATAGTYDLKTGTNQDGTPYYYIEDTASIALYGLRTKVAKFTQIRAVSGSKADMLAAANTLKLIAEAYIKRHLVPNVTYDVEVQMLRQPIKVGDTVRLSYRGVTESYTYLDIEDDFYVMDVTYKRSSDGGRSAKLTICNVSERRTSDQDVMVDAVSDIRALKIRVQPSAFIASYSALETVSRPFPPEQESYIDPVFTKTADFVFDIPSSVSTLTSLTFRMTTVGIESPVVLVFSGTTVKNMAWSPVQSRYYPYGLHLFLDGRDYTSQLGGPWGTKISAAGRPAPTNVLIDLTDTVNALSTIQGTHTITIKATYYFGYLEQYPGTPGANSQGGVSYGRVRGTITIQGTCMPIVAF